MTARPGRRSFERRIESDEPRSAAFRTSVAYADHCRAVSEALAPAYAGALSL